VSSTRATGAVTGAVWRSATSVISERTTGGGRRDWRGLTAWCGRGVFRWWIDAVRCQSRPTMALEIMPWLKLRKHAIGDRYPAAATIPNSCEASRHPLAWPSTAPAVILCRPPVKTKYTRSTVFQHPVRATRRISRRSPAGSSPPPTRVRDAHAATHAHPRYAVNQDAHEQGASYRGAAGALPGRGADSRTTRGGARPRCPRRWRPPPAAATPTVLCCAGARAERGRHARLPRAGG
jgi:hypothetical protein